MVELSHMFLLLFLTYKTEGVVQETLIALLLVLQEYEIGDEQNLELFEATLNIYGIQELP